MSAKTMAETFFRMLLQSLDRHIPETKYVVRKKRSNDNISPEIKNIKNRLDALATIATVTKDPLAYEIYKNCKEDYKKTYDAEIRQYYARKIYDASNPQKAIWNVIKTLSGRASSTYRSQENQIDSNRI
ncbi:hypothetical protein QE152_g29959 [Popillia japonica]|uniref:Uncharacterized protein n=1 Tax=Popillia japonica TaxID=7064 RepID=A0AAW1JFP8_POPJA